MEDPTFSDIISFIWLSGSQLTWLPLKNLYTLYQQPFLPRRKATKSSSGENENTRTPQLQHKVMRTKLWSHQTSVILYLIYTRSCVDLRRTEDGDFGAQLNQLFASFQRRKTKGAYMVLNMS